MKKPPVTVTASKRAPEVLEFLRKLPRLLTREQHTPEYNIFLGNFLAVLLAKIAQSYFIKSIGGTDSLGLSWKPLTPSTISAKERKHWLGHYQKSHALLRSDGYSGPHAVAEARRAAWQLIQNFDPSHINVATGRLLASFLPGQPSPQGYRPPPDQQVRMEGDHVRLRFSVPYAKHVHKKRPLLPPSDRMKPWVREAALEAAHETVKHLQGRL